MIFRSPETWPDGQSDHVPAVLRRWVSAAGMWTLELQRRHSSFEVRLHRRMPFEHRCVIASLYGLGVDRMAVALTPLVLMSALQGVAESASAQHVGDLLPVQTFDAIRDDRGCWRRLCAFAGLTHWAGVDLRLAGRFGCVETLIADEAEVREGINRLCDQWAIPVGGK